MKQRWQMHCDGCGYTRHYDAKWKAEESAKMHKRDNFCGMANPVCGPVDPRLIPVEEAT